MPTIQGIISLAFMITDTYEFDCHRFILFVTLFVILGPLQTMLAPLRVLQVRKEACLLNSWSKKFCHKLVGASLGSSL